MMAVFLVLMLVPDIGMRTHHYSEERMQRAAIPTDHNADGNVGDDDGGNRAEQDKHGAGH
jgi:hypothetical protein